MDEVPGAQLQAAFNAMYHAHARELMKCARSLVQRREVSEDIVQTVFVKTWAYLLRGGRIENGRAFLYRTLRNAVVDEYRRQRAVSLDALLEKGYEPSVNDFERTIDMLDGKAAFTLIDQLPHAHREVLHMKYADGLSLTEMAVLTDESANTLGVRLHRALVKLRLLYAFPRPKVVHARVRSSFVLNPKYGSGRNLQS